MWFTLLDAPEQVELNLVETLNGAIVSLENVAKTTGLAKEEIQAIVLVSKTVSGNGFTFQIYDTLLPVQDVIPVVNKLKSDLPFIDFSDTSVPRHPFKCGSNQPWKNRRRK